LPSPDSSSPPVEALRSVTSLAAQACGLGDRKGRIAPGYDADLLAVAGDPLTDLTTLTAVRAVFRAGSRSGEVPTPSAQDGVPHVHGGTWELEPLIVISAMTTTAGADALSPTARRVARASHGRCPTVTGIDDG